MENKNKIDVSVIIPVFNEVDSLSQLLDRLLPVCRHLGTFEIIMIDDGSTDGTAKLLEKLQDEHQEYMSVIYFRKNSGKSLALQAGFDDARGELVVMMDADLQDKPEEIPHLISYLKEQQLDAVTGRKLVRHDPLTKTFPSRCFNWMLQKLTKLEIHDFNCGLKVMRKECVKSLSLHGQLHRFMLVLLSGQGFKIGECEVEHSPRTHGKSKYGFERFYQGVMDMLTVIFLTRYIQSPLYFFGFYGMTCLCLSFIFGLYYIGLHVRYLMGVYSYSTPFPAGNLTEHPVWIFSPVLLLVGLVFICFGVLGEMSYVLLSRRPHTKVIRHKTKAKNAE